MGRPRYCAACGAATQVVVGEGRERDRCPGCGRVWYENAKPCAGTVVVESGRVLLVKRAIAPFLGCWDLPGGFLEADEHPADGARRETREETGLEVELAGLLGIYMDSYQPGDDPVDWHHSLNFFYLAHPSGGNLAPTVESSDVRWFAPDELPPLEQIAYKNGQRALTDWLTTLKN